MAHRQARPSISGCLRPPPMILPKGWQTDRFREDLFYRLNVMPIKLPPLRERPEDIPALCRFFITRFSETINPSVVSIAPEAMKQLLAYHWPGNVRELENTIQRGMVVSDGPAIEVAHLPDNILVSKVFRKGRSCICRACHSNRASANSRRN